jgi:hypothetical protein
MIDTNDDEYAAVAELFSRQETNAQLAQALLLVLHDRTLDRSRIHTLHKEAAERIGRAR